MYLFHSRVCLAAPADRMGTGGWERGKKDTSSKQKDPCLLLNGVSMAYAGSFSCCLSLLWCAAIGTQESK